MHTTVKIAIDAMGGDYSPSEVVKGAVMAAAEFPDVELTLVGPQETVEQELMAAGYQGETIRIRHAAEVITPEEVPVAAIRSKKDSSLVVGALMVKNGEADAFLSAGSTGALLAAGTLLVGRMKGVERPPLATLIPTKKGVCLLLDGGANVDAKPSQLVQFAQMGSLYMENVVGVTKPTVALLNIGTEEEKGNALAKETFGLLKDREDLTFVGNIEARQIPFGDADVVVCEAFAGNVALKMYEGAASLLLGEVKGVLKSSLLTMLGAALIQGPLKKALKKYDSKAYGGAPMLGLNGLVVKSHGNSRAREIRNTIEQCRTYVQQGTNEKIRACFLGMSTKQS